VFLAENVLFNALSVLKYQTGDWGRENLALGYSLDIQRAGSKQSTGEAYKGHFLNFGCS
jgi:uncharacterized protein YutD